MTKQAILKEILAHFPRTTGKVYKGNGRPYSLDIRTDHGKAERIGQFALRRYSQVYTYSACHIFRQAHLSIYFKR